MNNTTKLLCVLKSVLLVRESVQVGTGFIGRQSGIGRDRVSDQFMAISPAQPRDTWG